MEQNERNYFVIDSIEDRCIVLQCLETGEIFNVDNDVFIDEPAESNVIYLDNKMFKTDYEYTKKRKKSLAENLSRLLTRDEK